MEVIVPDALRRSVGEGATEWLAALPGIVSQLAARWRLAVGRPYPGGSHALVLAVSRADDTPAVLKVPLVDDENRAEAAALHEYDGDGAVRLYDADPESGALLLERLRPGTPLVDHPDREAAIDVVCRLLRRLRRPPPPAHAFPLVADLAEVWAEELPAAYERHGRPFARDLLDEAVEFARGPATAEDGTCLVNRDAHLGNVLAAEREPWLLIDPKPLVGGPSFDAGYLLWDLLGGEPTRAAAGCLVTRLAEGLDVDPLRVRGWALVRAVENALWVLGDGGDPSDYLIAAGAIAAVR